LRKAFDPRQIRAASRRRSGFGFGFGFGFLIPRARTELFAVRAVRELPFDETWQKRTEQNSGGFIDGRAISSEKDNLRNGQTFAINLTILFTHDLHPLSDGHSLFPNIFSGVFGVQTGRTQIKAILLGMNANKQK
jgi:hypothetical protein